VLAVAATVAWASPAGLRGVADAPNSTLEDGNITASGQMLSAAAMSSWNCCANCAGWYSYCSPCSNPCYYTQAKYYYTLCRGGASAPPQSTTPGCCGECPGSPFCSPCSNRCYAAKFKPYYMSCGGSAPAPPSAWPVVPPPAQPVAPAPAQPVVPAPVQPVAPAPVQVGVDISQCLRKGIAASSIDYCFARDALSFWPTDCFCAPATDGSWYQWICNKRQGRSAGPYFCSQHCDGGCHL